MERQPDPYNSQMSNLEALIQAIRWSLRSDAIVVRMQEQQPWLQVLFEAPFIPDRTVCIPLARRELQDYTSPGVRAIVIYGRRLGDQEAQWTYKYPLKEFSPTVAPPQSSAAPSRPSPQAPKRASNRLLIRVSALSLLGFSLGGVLGLLDHPQLQRLTSQLSQTLVASFSQNQEYLATSSTNPPAAETNLTEILPQTPEIPTPNLPSSITIKAVGDIIPGTNYPNHRLPADPGVFFAQVQQDLQGADILFGNYESTLTDHPHSIKDTSRGTQFAFRSPPSYADLFREVGFTILSIANNHSMDFGEVGFRDTIRRLNAADVATTGEKEKITYLEVEGVKVAFIGFSTYDFHNSINDYEGAKQLIREANKNAGIVVLSIHAGAEGVGAMRVGDRQEYFLGEDRGNIVRFSREAIEAGADLILGHGPHVARAINLHNNRLIAYSLADFLGYQTLSTQGALAYSLILEVELDLDGEFVSGRIIPMHLGNDGIPRPDPQFRSVDLIRNLTAQDFPDAPLVIDEKGQITVK
ncbi:CapA family protein [Sodalinema gerasimenkoae]|uniref:CapA family protein n=1 Tax=Sodalinema gerasimenkoae TaxID=2862348 RepID=UPI001C63F5DA|nr:CapA family protein [Sodalinema gerasimenkoae]